MSDSSPSTGKGCNGCLGLIAVLLTIAFVIMKIAEVGQVAEWSWVWVLSPAWIYVAWMVVLTIFGVVITAACLAIWGLIVAVFLFCLRRSK